MAYDPENPIKAEDVSDGKVKRKPSLGSRLVVYQGKKRIKCGMVTACRLTTVRKGGGLGGGWLVTRVALFRVETERVEGEFDVWPARAELLPLGEFRDHFVEPQ